MAKISSHHDNNLQNGDRNRNAIESRRFRIATVIALASLLVPTVIWWFSESKTMPVVITAPLQGLPTPERNIPEPKIPQSDFSNSDMLPQFKNGNEDDINAESSSYVSNYVTNNSHIEGSFNNITNKSNITVNRSNVFNTENEYRDQVVAWCDNIKIPINSECRRKYDLNIISEELIGHIEQIFINGHPIRLSLPKNKRTELMLFITNLGDEIYTKNLAGFSDKDLLNEFEKKFPSALRSFFDDEYRNIDMLINRLVSYEDKSPSDRTGNEIISAQSRIKHLKSLSPTQLKDEINKYKIGGSGLK